MKLTRGKVVTHKGKFIKAWFHSHAGGITATAKEGLDFKEAEPPYILVTKSPDADQDLPVKRPGQQSFRKTK